jgi:hypothetical protein
MGGLARTGRVRPRKLGHAVVGWTDYEATVRFLVDGFGFKASDYIKGEGAFVRLRNSKAPRACSPGDRPHLPHSSTPRISPRTWPVPTQRDSARRLDAGAGQGGLTRGGGVRRMTGDEKGYWDTCSSQTYCRTDYQARPEVMAMGEFVTSGCARTGRATTAA